MNAEKTESLNGTEGKEDGASTELAVTSQSVNHPTKFNIKNKKNYKSSKKVIIKDSDGIQSVKLNSKKVKIKTGKKSVSFKLAKYKSYLKTKKKWNKLTVIDMNGNRKTIKFKIK